MVELSAVELFTIGQVAVGFKYYMVVFLTVTLISVGILLLKNPFILFANATADLIDSLLDLGKHKSHKHKSLLNSFGNLLPKFGTLLFFIAMTLGVSFIPVVVYLEYNPDTAIRDLDMRSFYFFLSVILGSIALFIVPWANRNRDRDYSGWSMLLNRMILENYNISRALFRLEKKWFKKKASMQSKDFIIVSGLARGGSSALTNLLGESNKFHLLSYDSIPFLLSVNLWRKLHFSRRDKSKRSLHNDTILYGYKTIAALEEYFFKVFLDDGFISDHTLEEHEIDASTYEDYLIYQNLIRGTNRDSIYLAKNNNLILRYKSLRIHNPDFKILLIFREPVAHASSLHSQHKKFSDMQEADPYALEYMNWLGHHEFGLNHKVFHLQLMNLCDPFKDSSINYWIAIWISYYSHVLSLLEDKNLFLIEYADLCSSPKELSFTLGELLKLDLSVEQTDSYAEKTAVETDLDTDLLAKAHRVYEKLQKHKVAIK